MSEKEQIERETVEAFLRVYNAQAGASYRIVRHQDSPDFLCVDVAGDALGIEVTLTEDRPGDIQALLGRSESRSVATLEKFLEEVRAGKRDIREREVSMAGTALAIIMERVAKKLAKDYGRNVALVVRDTSGCEWSWELVIEEMRQSLDLSRLPFDRGIWILSGDGERVWRLDGSSS